MFNFMNSIYLSEKSLVVVDHLGAGEDGAVGVDVTEDRE